MEKLAVDSSLIGIFSTPADMLEKVEYDGNQLLHVNNNKMRHYILFNFCVSAHSLRDWVLKYLNVDSEAGNEFHKLWNANPLLQLVRDIANSTKHFGLDDNKKSISTGVQDSSVDYVGFFSVSDGLYCSDKFERSSVRISLSDGSFIELHDFVLGVYRAWLDIFKDNGISYGYFGNEALLYVHPEYLELAKSISCQVDD